MKVTNNIVVVIVIWFSALCISNMTFNLNDFHFNQSLVDCQGYAINIWTNIINQANLGKEVMHEQIIIFPLDLITIETSFLNK
ncbi:Photosystem II protein D1, partial [Mucuna pruriens]